MGTFHHLPQIVKGAMVSAALICATVTPAHAWGRDGWGHDGWGRGGWGREGFERVPFGALFFGRPPPPPMYAPPPQFYYAQPPVAYFRPPPPPPPPVYYYAQPPVVIYQQPQQIAPPAQPIAVQPYPQQQTITPPTGDQSRSLAVAENPYPALNPNAHHGQLRPKALALIIGIDHYENEPAAEFAENDAKSFYDYAVNALGIPKDRVKLLTGAQARRITILKTLSTWGKPLTVRGQTEVFVFFSGHGLAKDKSLFLLPYDGDLAVLNDSAIRRKDIIDTFVHAGAASTTLFLDTCFSGATRGKESLWASARPIAITVTDEAVPASVTIFAAAGKDQLSSALAATGHGLFSYYVMKGLEGDAAKAGHSISAADLETYLTDHVPQEAAKLGRSQTPQMQGDGARVLTAW